MIQLTKESLAVLAAAEGGDSKRAGVFIRKDGTTMATDGRIAAIVTAFHQDELFQIEDGGELEEDIFIDRAVIGDLKKRLASVKKNSSVPYLFIAGNGLKARAFSQFTFQSREDTTDVIPKSSKEFPNVAAVMPANGDTPHFRLTLGVDALSTLVQLIKGVGGKSVELEAYGSTTQPNLIFRVSKEEGQNLFGIMASSRPVDMECSHAERMMRDAGEASRRSATIDLSEVDPEETVSMEVKAEEIASVTDNVPQNWDMLLSIAEDTVIKTQSCRIVQIQDACKVHGPLALRIIQELAKRNLVEAVSDDPNQPWEVLVPMCGGCNADGCEHCDIGF